MADEDDVKTDSLFDEAVDVTGLEPEKGEEPEDYKGRVVLYFADLSDEDFDEALRDHADLAVWVKEATEVYKKNRGSRSPKKLPAMAGLAGDDADPEKKSKRARGEKKERKPREKKEPKERAGRDPEANRYYRLGELLIEDPDMTVDQLIKASAKLGYNGERTARRTFEAYHAISGLLAKHGMLKKAA